MSSYQEIAHRFFYLLAGWGTVGVIYSLTGDIHATAHMITPGIIDKAIMYNPNAVWVYLSFFLFIPCGYLLSLPVKANPLMWQMIVCAVLSGTVYLLYPTTADFPADTGSGLTQYLLMALLVADTPQNMLPSLHVSLTLITLAALWQKGAHYGNTLWLVWALVIILSVLYLKRHLFVDVFAVAICATVAIMSVRLFKMPFRVNLNE
ncbi:acid phosphatase [Morganella psychrotolerans]|uniref:Acid phosphatase n=1 Tax=Morganella psychrotolerans TaxID=368603 RepID=A0A1B8HSR8_9GAMM|nr:acid phosphatase [Morganella psychrotolerans]OBU12938.1 acid phosphatase [Morganella psychrotolerans]